jgi:quercetin dioxygenase-like cupin family protein
LIFALYERPEGVAVGDETRVVYDLERNVAHRGATRVAGPAVVWALGGSGDDAALAVEVELNPVTEWVARCDRVDFPPGGTAYRHVHPGPGIRRLLFGELTIESTESTRTHRAGEAWFEGADFPVLATASATEDSAFVRVLLLPREWEGKRTIRYLDPSDDERPKLQRATILLEHPIEL